MTRARILFKGLAALPLLLLGCIKGDGSSGGTSGTALYLFDSTGSQILVWKDMEATAAASTTPGADAALTNSALTRSQPLAWGGMAVDTQRNRLYLLYQDGSVVRVDQLRSQTGAIQSSNVVLFTLDTSASPLTGSVFGQLALDAQTDTLYACETGSSSSRIWAVGNPDALTNGAKVPLATVSDDENGKGALGIAAGRGAIYTYSGNGDPVVTVQATYNGPRLRKGAGAALTPGRVIIGDETGLDASAAGSMALDTAGSTVFVGLDVGSTGANSPTGGAPVLAFQTGQFGLAPNQKPTFWLAGSASGTLMSLAHAGTKAWLVGLIGTKSAGGQSILVWKQPAAGVAPQTLTLGPSGAQYLAAALDGSGS